MLSCSWPFLGIYGHDPDDRSAMNPVVSNLAAKTRYKVNITFFYGRERATYRYADFLLKGYGEGLRHVVAPSG